MLRAEDKYVVMNLQAGGPKGVLEFAITTTCRTKEDFQALWSRLTAKLEIAGDNLERVFDGRSQTGVRVYNISAGEVPPEPTEEERIEREALRTFTNEREAEVEASIYGGIGVALQRVLVEGPGFVGSMPGTGTKCSVCGEPQYSTPSGDTCINGHGDAPPK